MSRSSFTVMVVETFHSEQQTSVSRKSERVSQQTSSSGNHECLMDCHENIFLNKLLVFGPNNQFWIHRGFIFGKLFSILWC